MKLETITLTGADDSIDPQELVNITREYPNAEFGILLSRSQEGSKRFPSYFWMQKLAELKKNHKLNLSGHLCGRWVRDFLMGEFTFPYPEIWEMFQRIQLNFHAEALDIDFDGTLRLLKTLGAEKDFILQVDGRNDWLFSLALEQGANVYPLFDLSHGAGVLPELWPAPIHSYLCGYAGGLGPDNLKGQLDLIAAAAGSISVWVDMETKLRSFEAATGDEVFDPFKCRACLMIASKWREKNVRVAA